MGVNLAIFFTISIHSYNCCLEMNLLVSYLDDFLLSEMRRVSLLISVNTIGYVVKISIPEHNYDIIIQSSKQNIPTNMTYTYIYIYIYITVTAEYYLKISMFLSHNNYYAC